MTVVKTLGKYGRAFLILLTGGYLLLLLAGLIPQRAVNKSVGLSASQLSAEGYAPVFFIGSDESYRLNNFTEARILLTSLYMDVGKTPAAVLINPTFDGENDPIAAINALAETGEFPPADTYLPGSILGNRAVIRPLLSVMNLRQIRRLTMWLMLLLFSANVLSIRRHSSVLMSFLFTAAFLSVNPILIMSSLQNACCFLIAFIAMLCMPGLGKRRISEPMAFFIIGAATQYFDAYSFPVVTFGLPMVVRLLVKQREGELLNFKADLRYTGSCLAAWLAAYGLMWLANIFVTQLFTDFSAWRPAVEALLTGLGVAGGGDPLAAMAAALKNLTTIECAACLVGFGLAWPFMMDTRARRKVGYKQGRIFLLIALLPLIWLCAASHSAMDNGYYEYRGLIVTIFAALCFYAKPTQYLEKNMKRAI